MKAKFQVGERFLLLSLLPSEANLITLRLVREMKRKIGFSSEEIKALDFQFDEAKEQTRWKTEADVPVELEFSDVETSVIEKELQKLDKTSRLTENHLSLCEKFKLD